MKSPWGTAKNPQGDHDGSRVLHLNHTTWECKYHVVFTPKYRKKVLFGQIRRHLGTVFHELAWARGYFVSTVGRNVEMIRAYIRIGR